jgi:hypothetical protein
LESLLPPLAGKAWQPDLSVQGKVKDSITSKVAQNRYKVPKREGAAIRRGVAARHIVIVQQIASRRVIQTDPNLRQIYPWDLFSDALKNANVPKIPARESILYGYFV